MKFPSFTPVLLSRILMACLALGAALVGLGFYFAEKQLNTKAVAVNHVKIDNDLAQNEIQRLKQLRDYLTNNSSAIQRAAEVVSESQQYQYQNQVIDDINAYASKNSVRILSFDFPVTDTGTVAPGPGGLKKIGITVNVDGPLPYQNLMKFVRSIEQNLTKMQISTLTLTPAEDPKQIANSTVGLEVYLR